MANATKAPHRDSGVAPMTRGSEAGDTTAVQGRGPDSHREAMSADVEIPLATLEARATSGHFPRFRVARSRVDSRAPPAEFGKTIYNCSASPCRTRGWIAVAAK